MEQMSVRRRLLMERTRTIKCKVSDVSTQTVIEVLNTLCWQMQMKDFRSTDQMLHPVVEEAQKTVKERIANYKQKKDFKQT